ncbi:hypothetical protein HPP92_006698 [Vanilla planifolia]|uniref:DUF7887 domain-containing protein n=1 Tax=Vanilla planifolia TaxID=51239 RepID=A0A835RKZ2_VANPL|nr:hypothetical protein HPP92_006698 [Vanilla planifolia]
MRMVWTRLDHVFKPGPLRVVQIERNSKELRPTQAKKTNMDFQNGEPNFRFRVSRALVARSAIAVFALGFIDAGYSGDWSRVGVLSNDAEVVLKSAAYLVVPLCFLLILFISGEEKSA